VDDFFHTHDAADGHVQSRFEQWADGLLGAIGVVGTAVGAGAAAKTVQTLGVNGTVAAGAAYARATAARVGTGARGLIDDVLRAGKNASGPVKASGLFHGASDHVNKYWDDYYRAVGSHGDDLTAATARLRQLGFDVRSGEAAALVKGTNVIEYGPRTKTWELYEEAIHHSVQRGLGTQEIAALTKQLKKSYWQRSIRSGSPADAAEEIFVKTQLLRRLDLDAHARTLLGQQIENLRLRGMNGGY
jgi:hypothetical protein